MLSGIKKIFSPRRKLPNKDAAVEQAEGEISALPIEKDMPVDPSLSVEIQNEKTLSIVKSIMKIMGDTEKEQSFLEKSADLLMEQYTLSHVDLYLLDQIEENMIQKVFQTRVDQTPNASGGRLSVARSESANLLMQANKIHIPCGRWNYYIDTPIQSADTSASLILPLTYKDNLYGLMHVQSSSEPHYLNREPFELFAGLIAQKIAIDRIIDQTKELLQESGPRSESNTQVGWEELAGGGKVGYSYDRLHLSPTDETFPQDVANQLLAGRSATFITSDTPPRARLVAPITLRDATIGVIGYDSDNIEHEWQEDEKALLETVASRVSLALENTRLVSEAQQRAERERMISQITSKMRETLDIETILKTAVTEIRQSLGLSEAEVRLQLAEGNKTPEVDHE